MPLLPYVVGTYLTRVKDSLKYGPHFGARATAEVADGLVHFEVDEPGSAGNDYSIGVGVPGGTTPLDIQVVGSTITINLSVNAGAPVDADNTTLAVANALNAEGLGITARYTDDGTGVLDTLEAPVQFSGGEDADTNFASVNTPGYLRAQDLATVLELLQDGLDTGSMTVVSGTTTTLVDGASTFTAGQQVGNVVVFDGNVTAALAGVEARVLSNTTTTLTFAEALPAAPAAGDTYSIRGGLLDTHIDKLRQGKDFAQAPAGNVYGDTRQAVDALHVLIEQLGGSMPVRTASRPGLTTGSGSTTTVVVSSDADMKIDQFKGMTLTVSGETRRIVSNNESSFTLAKALTSAPAASTALSVQLPTAVDHQYPGRFHFIHPGGHPETAVLALLIETAQSAVESYTLPT